MGSSVFAQARRELQSAKGLHPSHSQGLSRVSQMVIRRPAGLDHVGGPWLLKEMGAWVGEGAGRTICSCSATCSCLQIKRRKRSSHCGAVEMNPTRNHEVEGSIPGLSQWVEDLALP